MLKVGKSYKATTGERFLILAKKSRPSSNGCNFIGENTKTGVIAYFDFQGKHAWEEKLNLECDPFKWIGLEHLTEPTSRKFVKRGELTKMYSAYLRMIEDDPTTIQWVSVEGFEASYV